VAEIVVHRPGAPDLVFQGELLASGTSKDHDTQRRWQEVAIWRTDHGRYVTQLLGRSIAPGEKDRGSTSTYDNPADVWKGLVRKGSNMPAPYLTDLATQVLVAAALKDAALVAALEAAPTTRP
jgi:hypothetical protein